jgi:hypothetical protein|nr:MAG TPA: hypothetical protein [Caudoviricetes sp.]DAJ17407.1 MAG TPA: hypothetical protein [Siphoviridae sp. ctpCx1]
MPVRYQQLSRSHFCFSLIFLILKLENNAIIKLNIYFILKTGP